MTPLLVIDCRTLRVRRYVRRELGLHVNRLDMTDEAYIEPPQTETLLPLLEDFRLRKESA